MEGSNSEIDIRWAAADVELMKGFAKELVSLQPDLILTSSTPATVAVLQQTPTIPVIFVLVADPVGSGFVANLSRPGGNATGFTPIVGSLGGKWVELLKQIAPRVSRVMLLLYNPPTATFIEGYLNPFKTAAARSLGVQAIVAPVNDMPGSSRIPHCHRGTRAKQRPRRDTGCLHYPASRGDHGVSCALPYPCHLLVPRIY